MRKYIKLLVIAFIITAFLPGTASAAWWNPFSWNWSSPVKVAPITNSLKVQPTNPPQTPKKTTTTPKKNTNKPVVTPTLPTIPTTKSNVTPINSKAGEPSNKPIAVPPVQPGTYSVESCYNTCDGYDTSVQRDLCKHSQSTASCDLYGKPGPALDSFVAAIKTKVSQAQAARTSSGTYSVQECYNVCDGRDTATQRDLCKHSQSTASCDLYGQPGSALDSYVNAIKAEITQTVKTTSGVYSVQECYNTCEGYSTYQSRDLCKHSKSTFSCDLYGQPGSALDNFVEATKKKLQLINQVLPIVPITTKCPVNTSGGDVPMPVGCVK